MPEKAFGLKYPNLVRVMSVKDFARQQIIPVAGSIVMLDNIAAKIKSVNSGRVVVDFNHPLAGEPVVYSLKVVEVIDAPEKKLKEMLVSLGINGTVSKSGKGFTVSFAASEPAQKVQAAKKGQTVNKQTNKTMDEAWMEAVQRETGKPPTTAMASGW